MVHEVVIQSIPLFVSICMLLFIAYWAIGTCTSWAAHVWVYVSVSDYVPCLFNNVSVSVSVCVYM